LEIHPVDVIISLINIIVLFILLRAILWKHVNRFLSERKARVQKEMDDAAEARKNAEALQAEYKQKLSELEGRGKEIISESRRKANEESTKIIDEAKVTATTMINEADERIEASKKQALLEAHAEVTNLATEMASRILKREVESADNARAVDEFFREP